MDKEPLEQPVASRKRREGLESRTTKPGEQQFQDGKQSQKS